MNHEEWGEGPWNNEEDHAVWVDGPTDLDCMINRGPSGALCGYVGVGPDHPLHGMLYDHVNHLVEVHGGLTYSKACDGDICHVPEEGREHDIWWFGFDTAHFMDFAPRIAADMRRLYAEKPELAPPDGEYDPFPSVYRDWAYVCGEIVGLAAQLDQMR